MTNDEIAQRYQSFTDLELVYNRHQVLYCGQGSRSEMAIAEQEYAKRWAQRGRDPSKEKEGRKSAKTSKSPTPTPTSSPIVKTSYKAKFRRRNRSQ